MTKSIKMSQVAQDLGVSQVTVSAVVNGREKKQRVSPKTVKRIRKYLDKCGYVQSKSALQIKGVVTNPVGILYCGDFVQFTHLQKSLSILTKHIEEKYGIVEISGISIENIKHGIREQVAKGVKRLIWFHANPPETERINAETLFPLLNRMEKVVIYNFDSQNDLLTEEYLNRGINLVGFDRGDSYHKVADLLHKQGYKKVALNEIFWAKKEGLSGTEMLNKTFRRHGLEVYGLMPGKHKFVKKLIPAITDNLIKLHRKEHVCCAFLRSNLLAAEVMKGIIQAGIRVPEDIAIIGFGDTPFSDFLSVPLTTFRHPVEEMCNKTIELIEGTPKKKGEKFFYKNMMILRKSHKKEI